MPLTENESYENRLKFVSEKSNEKIINSTSNNMKGNTYIANIVKII